MPDESSVTRTDPASTGEAGEPPRASPAELLFPDLGPELAATRRMLEITPDEPADWRPHERSWELSRLATHVAELPAFPALMLAHDDWEQEEFNQPQKLTDAGRRLEVFDERAEGLREHVEALTWERALEPWVMRIGGEVVLEGKRAELVRRLGLSHMAHHRAQLGLYLRQLDIPIFGPYGPSSDEGPPSES